MEERETPETKKDSSTKKPQAIRVRAGVRAGTIEGSWKLGNKIWHDDWLAPV